MRIWDQTPWQQIDGIWVKRDDLFRVGATNGGKARSCLWIGSQAKARGLVGAAGRGSSQLTVVAGVAAAACVPCQMHVPAGEATFEILAAEELGAEVVRHRPGYGSVISARARQAAEDLGWTLIPYRMETNHAVVATSGQVRREDWPEIDRLVVPVGSGMSLSGILRGMYLAQITTPVLGITAGADPTKNLDKYAPEDWRSMVKLETAAGGYHKLTAGSLGGVDLDPAYEAKCLEHLRPGDGLWIVGRGIKRA